MGRELAIDETVRVAVRALPAGTIVPKSFEWRGKTHFVIASGRQWVEAVDGVRWRCFLVQTQGQNSFELRWEPVEDEWVLHRGWLVNLV